MQRNRHLQITKNVAEMLREISNLETNEQKIERLRLYKSKSMDYIIYGFFNVDWDGMVVPKYKPSNRPMGATESSISHSIARINAAYKWRNQDKERSKNYLLLVLESVHKDEAQLISNMINGIMPYDIDRKVFKAVYPDFFHDEIKSEEV